MSFVVAVRLAHGSPYINDLDLSEPVPSQSLLFVQATSFREASNSLKVALNVSSQANVLLGQQIALESGIIGQEWECLYQLGMAESGWNSDAQNKVSGAFGIPQSLPASKLDSYGDRHDPIVQIHWFIDYIQNRYDTPCKALRFQKSHVPNWY